ncbi:MAG: hypothetical protein NTV79_05270, partial [Candidatus Aureabacteria bacterium]|nr:hypothetical protein [Candidatus Auribacterota bacterium]
RVSEGKATFDLSRLGPCAQDANGVIFVSANDFMQTVLNLLPAGKIEGLLAETLKSFASLDLPLVVCFQAAGETIRASTAVPMEKILAVKKLFENKRAPAPEPAAPPAQPPEIPAPPAAE